MGYKCINLKDNTGENTLIPADVYSTDEIKIGTWVDGKPIYRKTYVGTASVSNNYYTLEQIANLDTLVSVNGSLIGGTSMQAIGSYINNSNYSGLFVDASKNIQVWVSSSSYNKYHITIEFTKTTD